MKKADLIAQLEGAKALTSVVSIDNVIALIQSLEPESRVEKVFGMSQELADRIEDRIQRTLDYNCGNLADLSSAEFELSSYDNRIELTRVDINLYDVMDHVNAVLAEFIVVEDELEEEFREAQDDAAEEGVLRDAEE
jgi:hypothetical protein